ncbi:MAG: CBS domain-containing protein [Bacteriovoracaceae bacterium]|nr:CBS domain-containing protein [Bacteriovoracaceae bacterium]
MIKKIMSKSLQTIGPDETMHSANLLMKKYSIRHLPVVNKEGRFIGILSDRDIQRAMTVIKSDEGNENHLQTHKKVADFMTSPIHTVKENDSIEQVARDMLEMKVSCFLIEEETTKTITGIVTTDDLLIYLLDILSENKSHFNLKKFFRLK